ncbi:MAG: hypothetical protein M3401_03065 [Actinomycetota bacterium]|nr:hypothetical protein [Actinomycetota bacterium]
MRRTASARLGASRSRAETLSGAIPHDECFHEADRAVRAPLDEDPEAPAIRAIDDLAARLITVGV